MSDVVRFDSDIQEVVYTVGPETIRRAVLNWLEDNHSAVFTEETTIRFCEGNSMAVTTLFPNIADAGGPSA